MSLEMMDSVSMANIQMHDKRGSKGAQGCDKVGSTPKPPTTTTTTNK